MHDPTPQWPQPKNIWESLGLIIGILALFGALPFPDARSPPPAHLVPQQKAR